jgi:hypothetical protein
MAIFLRSISRVGIESMDKRCQQCKNWKMWEREVEWRTIRCEILNILYSTLYSNVLLANFRQLLPHFLVRIRLQLAYGWLTSGLVPETQV